MDMSDFFVSYGWMVLIALGFAIYGFLKLKARSIKIQRRMDAILLRMPIFGDIVRKGTIARWGRTTATLFAASACLWSIYWTPLLSAAGNLIYEEATREIRTRVIQGLSMTSGMRATELFPNMMLQMSSIGEESGSLDDMLNKAAEFYEDEVDNAVGRLSAMMEADYYCDFGLGHRYASGRYVSAAVQLGQRGRLICRTDPARIGSAPVCFCFEYIKDKICLICLYCRRLPCLWQQFWGCWSAAS